MKSGAHKQKVSLKTFFADKQNQKQFQFKQKKTKLLSNKFLL